MNKEKEIKYADLICKFHATIEHCMARLSNPLLDTPTKCDVLCEMEIAANNLAFITQMFRINLRFAGIDSQWENRAEK